MPNLKTALPLKLTILVIVMMSWCFLKFTSAFTTPTNTRALGESYANSQYVMGEGSPRKIDDATLYAYAGTAYAKGEDPTTINFEHPPLAKYLFGFSYLLFGNVNVLSLVIYAGTLIAVYHLALKIFKQENWALAAVALTGTLTIFQEHASQTLLDLPMLMALLGFFNSLFSTNKNRFWWQGIWLGAFGSIKYGFPSLYLLLLILGFWHYREKTWRQLPITLFTALGIYLLNYVVFFFYHPNPIEFLKFEWYRFRWWTGARTIPKFLIFDTLFTGTFKGWWAADVKETAASWSLLWPALFLAQLFSALFMTRQSKIVAVLFFYAQALLLLYAFGSAAYARYLLQLLPLWIILSLWLVKKTNEAIQKKPLVPNKPRHSR